MNDFEIGIVFPNHVAISQLEVWLPYLIKSPYKVCLFAQTCSQKIIDKIPFPIFTIDSGFSIYEVEKFTKLEFLFYPTNRSRNFNWLLKFPHIKHIFIGHGDSEKHSSSSRIINAYDFTMLSDFDSYKRYTNNGVNLGLEKCLFMGVPTKEGIEYQRTPCNEIKSVLYAPTFEGNSEYVNYSSLGKIHNIIFHDRFDIIFRPHPGTGKRDIHYKNIAAQYEKSTLSKVEQFNKSDILVCDISGIKNEYLFTGKPIVIPATYEEINTNTLTALEEYCYIWDYKNTSFSDFINSIRRDEKWKKRIKYRKKKYLGCKTFDDSQRLFLKALEFTKKSCLERRFSNIISSITMDPIHLFSHSVRKNNTQNGRSMNEIKTFVPAVNISTKKESIMKPSTLTCPVCGSPSNELIINVPFIDEEHVVGEQRLFVCSHCFFINFPSNTTKKLDFAYNAPGHRAGSLTKPGRETFYFEAIQKFIFPDKKNLSVCIYGAGLSYDHVHIRNHHNVSEVKITDLENYQKSDFFVDSPVKKFDLVIASEVAEHFENPQENFKHLLSFVSDSGLILVGTNIHVPNSKLNKLSYPFAKGHCAYWSPEALELLTSRHGYKLFFMNTTFGGPKKRAIFIFKNEDILKRLVRLTGKKQVLV